MLVDKYTYQNTQPFKLLLQKHHILIPSLKHKPTGKRTVKVKIKPPRQMSNKWFFQESFADTGLVQISAAAADFGFSYQGCCNSNNQITLYTLNTEFYRKPGWGNANPEGTYSSKWYFPFTGVKESEFMNYSGIDYTGKTVTGSLNLNPQGTATHYEVSTSIDNGWFQPKFLSIVDLKTHNKLVH